jgi:hypothetical protein
VTSNGYTGTTVRGIAERVNERGIKLNGDWLNVSKFKPLELPPEGSHVIAVVDAKGFLTSVQVLDEPAATDKVSRNETITRLAVLKAAAHFLGLLSQSREEVRSEHVLTLADRWLAWVDADHNPSHPSSEAF